MLLGTYILDFLPHCCGGTILRGVKIRVRLFECLSRQKVAKMSRKFPYKEFHVTF